MEQITDKKSNLSIIPAHEFLAIQLRYQGMQYDKISLQIKQKYDLDVPKTTIAWWFYKNGKLLSLYREYADQMVELEMEEARDFIRGNVSKAAKVLAQVMQGVGGPAQVMAAKEFLERGLGKVKDEVDLKHSGTVGVAMLDVLQAIKETKNEQGQNQNNIQGAE